MDVNPPDHPPTTATPIDPAEASFDIVARQESTEAAVADLRSDLDRVKARIGRAARPALGTGDEAAPEVKGFVDGYLRRGATQEIKSITAGVPGDGGYAVPRQIDAAIARQLTEISPIRAIAQVVQTGSADYRKLVTLGGTASGWVSESAGRPETATPNFSEIAPPTGELYANPAASQAMLDDAGFDLESWLASEIGQEFARAEGAAFINGSGVNQPLVEQDELYEVGLGDPDRPARIWATAGPQLVLEAGEIAALGESYEGAALWVRQKGSFAVSPPLHLISLSTLAERKMP